MRAYVMRCGSSELGLGHPDTAASAHNLGVMLDVLGKSATALALVQSAHEVQSLLSPPVTQ